MKIICAFSVKLLNFYENLLDQKYRKSITKRSGERMNYMLNFLSQPFNEVRGTSQK